MNDFRSSGTRITFSVAVDVDEKESTARNATRVGARCIVKESEEERMPDPTGLAEITSSCT